MNVFDDEADAEADAEVDVDIDFDKVFLMSAYEEIIKNNHTVTIEQVESFIDICSSNMSYLKDLGLFDLCEDLMVNERFGDFSDCVLKIVALNPEILYEVGTTGYNLFMLALDYYHTIYANKLIGFLEELNRLMPAHKKMKLLNFQELTLIDNDVLNSVSGSDIPEGEEDEYDDDRRTILSLALETKNLEIVETCIFMGCHKIGPDDSNEPLEFFELIEAIIPEYHQYGIFREDHKIYIENFENKFKILLAIGLSAEIGMISIFFGIAEDLKEYMMDVFDEDVDDF